MGEPVKGNDLELFATIHLTVDLPYGQFDKAYKLMEGQWDELLKVLEERTNDWLDVVGRGQIDAVVTASSSDAEAA